MNRIPRFAHRSPPTPGDRFRAFSHPLAALSCLFLFTMAFGLAPPARAQGSDLVTAPVNPGNRISLTGRHPAWASAQNDLGAVPADLPLGPMELELARSPQQEQAYEQYLRELQDPASPYYHHWLSPTQIGQRFGASQHDLDAIANWLQSQNLHVVSVANSRVRIRFSGPASAVGGAFGAEMHYYRVDGEQRLSISAEPQIPAALAGIIKSISGLYTIKIRPMHISGTFQVPTGSLAGGISSGVSPAGTIDGSHFLFPSDFATIYDLPGEVSRARARRSPSSDVRVFIRRILQISSRSPALLRKPRLKLFLPTASIPVPRKRLLLRRAVLRWTRRKQLWTSAALPASRRARPSTSLSAPLRTARMGS